MNLGTNSKFLGFNSAGGIAVQLPTQPIPEHQVKGFLDHLYTNPMPNVTPQGPPMIKPFPKKNKVAAKKAGSKRYTPEKPMVSMEQLTSMDYRYIDGQLIP